MARVPFNTTIEESTAAAIRELSAGTTLGRFIDMVVVYYRDRPKYDMADVVERLDGIGGQAGEALRLGRRVVRELALDESDEPAREIPAAEKAAGELRTAGN